MSSIFARPSLAMSLRSGFHKPDPPVVPDEIAKKRFNMLEINREFYHDTEPQFGMNYHNPDVITQYHGYIYFFAKLIFMGLPFLFVLSKIVKAIGGNLQPWITPCEDDKYRGPYLINWLKNNR